MGGTARLSPSIKKRLSSPSHAPSHARRGMGRAGGTARFSYLGYALSVRPGEGRPAVGAWRGSRGPRGPPVPPASHPSPPGGGGAAVHRTPVLEYSHGRVLAFAPSKAASMGSCPPAQPLALTGVRGLDWAPDRGSVITAMNSASNPHIARQGRHPPYVWPPLHLYRPPLCSQGTHITGPTPIPTAPGRGEGEPGGSPPTHPRKRPR